MKWNVPPTVSEPPKSSSAKRVPSSVMCAKLLLVLTAFTAAAQQMADPSFDPNVQRIYPSGEGPTVHLDHAHRNFHRIDGRYRAFAQTLEKAGFQVKSNDAPFSAAALKNIRILAIANALSPRNERNWTLPTTSAFTSDEIAALETWVKNGGALLLIADHMPFPGCAKDLAAAFGIEFSNGYALEPGIKGPILFRHDQSNLKSHAVTKNIEQVATFTGSAFRTPPAATPLLVFSPKAESALTERANQILPETPRQPIGGWLQGALLPHGKGRLAIFGEASMFSAQLSAAKSQMGMNSPLAKDNATLLIQVLQWLNNKL